MYSCAGLGTSTGMGQADAQDGAPASWSTPSTSPPRVAVAIELDPPMLAGKGTTRSPRRSETARVSAPAVELGSLEHE